MPDSGKKSYRNFSIDTIQFLCLPEAMGAILFLQCIIEYATLYNVYFPLLLSFAEVIGVVLYLITLPGVSCTGLLKESYIAMFD